MIRTIFVLFCFFSCTNAFCKARPTEVEKLAMTCKVWGFLKYYHPQVATGKYNWDAALINFLPYTLKSKTWEELNVYAFTSILSIGPVQKCETCDEINPKWFDKNFDLSWTDDPQMLSNELIHVLNYIEANRNQKENYFAIPSKGGFLDFSNEISRGQDSMNNAGIRLLDLFRYWNIVEYFFPYKFNLAEDWDSVLYVMIPKFVYSTDSNEFLNSILELNAFICDGHAKIISNEGTDVLFERMVPVIFKWIEEEPVVYKLVEPDSIQSEGIRIGDVLIGINDSSVNHVFATLEKINPASNEIAKRRNFGLLLGWMGLDSVKLSVRRDEEILDFYIKIHNQDRLANPFLKSRRWEILDKNTGYINMGSIDLTEFDQAMSVFSNCSSIIIDLRNYPEKSVFAIAQYFLNDYLNFALFLLPDCSYPGKFLWEDTAFIENSVDSALLTRKYFGPIYTGSIYILVDEWTQSDAEGMVMSLQQYEDCTVIGSTTSGALGRSVRLPFYKSYSGLMSGIGVFYPDTSEVQRNGVSIDCTHVLSHQGILRGKDELLEFTINLIYQGERKFQRNKKKK